MDAARRLQDLTRIGAMALVVALPLFAGYMFVPRQLICALAVAVLALLACVGALLSRRGGQARSRAVEWTLAFFLVWLMIATTKGVGLHAGIIAVLQALGYVAFMLLWTDLFREGAWRRLGWMSIAAGGAVAGFFGLRDWTQTAVFQGDLSWRTFGTFYNPNCLAGYLVVALPAAILVLIMAWRAATSPDRPDRPRLELILAGFALLIPTLTIFLTASRAGVLGAMLGLFVLAIAMPTRIHRHWLVVAALGLVALVMIAPPLRNRMLSLATQSHSAVFRWYTWQGTADMIMAHPVTGFGPGSFEESYQRYAQTGFTRMAHQTPLQIAAEAGLPALLAALLALGLIVRELVRGLRRGGERAFGVAAGLAALAALGFQNLADYTWYIPAVGLTLSALVGLARAEALPDTDDAPRRPARLWLGLVACLLVMGGCAVGLQAQGLADRGRAALARGSYRVAGGWLGQATKLDPYDPAILEELAQALAGQGTPASAQASVRTRQRVAELCPFRAGNYLGLAWLYDALGEPESAIASARDAVYAAPNNPRGYATRARLLIADGRDDEALEVYRELEEVYHSPVGKYQAVEEASDYAYAEAWVALGREALESGEPARAREYLRDAIDEAGEYARLQRAREKTLRLLGDWDERRVAEAERLEALAKLLLRDAGGHIEE